MNRRLMLITGGSKGIGFSISKEFIRDHDIAIIFKSDTAQAEIAKKDLEQVAPDSKVEIYKCNITDYGAVVVTYEKIKSDFGRSPHCLVNNAGIASPCLVMLESMESFHEITNTNYLAPVHLTKLAVKDMCRQKFGRVVFISTNSAGHSLKGHAAYTSSKVALEKFGVILGGEVAKYNVTVNSVRPGLIATEMTKIWIDSFDKNSEKYKKLTLPSGELTQPQHVAEAVRYATSGIHINCTALIVDGGFSSFRSQ